MSRQERLQNELTALLALEPPDVSSDLEATMATLKTLQERRQHLAAGTGRYQRTPIGRIARQLTDLETDLADAHSRLDQAKPWEKPKLRRLIGTLHNYQAATIEEWDQHAGPEARRLHHTISQTEDRAAQLQAENRFNRQWHRDHPDHARKVATIRHRLANTTLHEAEQRALPARSQRPEPALNADTKAGIDRLNAKLDQLQQQPKNPPAIGGLGL
jgi:hypothetical protein